MKQLFTILIVAIPTFFSCKTETTKKIDVTVNKENQHIPNAEFVSYLSTLDQIPLPLKHNPLRQLPELSNKYNPKGFEKFKHAWTSKPLGILYKNKHTVAIIDCSIGDLGPVPFLTTYDMDGNKIDSTGFYKKSGRDRGYSAIEYLTFDDGRIISVVDTVKRWQINEEELNIVEGSMKITTGQTIYRILKNGKIEKK